MFCKNKTRCRGDGGGDLQWDGLVEEEVISTSIADPDPVGHEPFWSDPDPNKSSVSGPEQKMSYNKK